MNRSTFLVPTLNLNSLLHRFLTPALLMTLLISMTLSQSVLAANTSPPIGSGYQPCQHYSGTANQKH